VKIKLVYLARLREVLGRSMEEVDIPSDVHDVAGVVEWLRKRGERWDRELASGSRIRVAVDHSMAESTTPVRDGAEVAFFPPVTGGCSGPI
jgi:molybdopterin synthase sulfur carrier subunit